MNVLDKDFSQLYEELLPDIETCRQKHILIAGATGMLAMYMTQFFIYINEQYDMQMELYLLARSEQKLKNKYGQETLAKTYIHLLIQDVCEPVQCADGIDYILHAAGSADPKSIVNHPVGILRANTLGTLSLCELACAKKSELLFLSTREIYGSVDEQVTELNETAYGGIDPLHSRSCYPESKKSAEAILKAYSDEFQMNFKIARIAHSYGPGMEIENDGRIMADMMHDLVHRQDFILKSDGQMKRSFCYISDCIKALLLILLKGQYKEAYNVANETEEIRIVDLAEMMADMAGTAVVFKEQSDADKKGYLQIPRVTLDTAKLEGLGWFPSVPLQEGIRRTRETFYS